MGKHARQSDSVYQPRHAGDSEDGQARADVLNSLPTYQTETASSEYARRPIPVCGECLMPESNCCCG